MSAPMQFTGGAPWSTADTAFLSVGVLTLAGALLFCLAQLLTDGKYLPKAVYKDAADSNRCPPGHR